MTNLMSRRYDVAEYFFNTEATEHLELVEAAVDHVYAGVDNHGIREAFNLYLLGSVVNTSTGICGNRTAGFGKLDENGYFQFPLPGDFINKFIS